MHGVVRRRVGGVVYVRGWSRSLVAVAVVAASFAVIDGVAPLRTWAATVPAPSPATISCDVSTAYLAQNSPTQLFAEEFGSGTVSFSAVAPAGTYAYNGMGLDPLNGYLYAIEVSPTAGELLRINPGDATVEDLGALSPAISFQNSGAFSPDGDYYVFNIGSSTMYKIDVTTATATPITLSASPRLSDITWAGGYLWGIPNNTNTPIRIDPDTGEVTTFGSIGITASTYGADFTLGNGDIELGDNSGGLTEVRIDDPGSATPTFTVVATSSSPGSGQNDGAACVSAPTHLSVSMSAPTTVDANASLSWTLTVKNEGTGAASGFTLTDDVPAGYAIGAMSSGCSASGQTVTCVHGGLDPGDSAVLTISATAPGSYGCASSSNSATVVGYEENSEPTNTDSTSALIVCVSHNNPQAITFTQPADATLADGTVTLTASSDSGLTVSFTSTTPTVCTVTGTTATLVAAGTCTIEADQYGDDTYGEATPVTRSFAVTLIPQVITFAQPAPANLSAGTVALTASSDAGLPVSFTSTTPAVCTVAGTTITLLAVGTCTIDADQAGDATHAAATTIIRSFAVVSSSHTAPVVTSTRIAGDDRDATTAKLAEAMYPTAGSAKVVVLARDDVYADGLAGSPLAGALGGPLLLTPTSALSSDVRAAIQHVLAPGGLVICLGQNDAISTSVVTQLQSLGYQVNRIGGVDRYATATLIAGDIVKSGAVTHAYLATGDGFADALPSAVAAGFGHGVVLLTAGKSMPASTSKWLHDHAGLTVTAVGGAAAAAAPDAAAIAGTDRYATSAMVAATVMPDPSGLVLATGGRFPDGLAGAVYAIHHGWSLLLVAPGPTTLNSSQTTYLHDIADSTTTVTAVGGADALPPTSVTLITNALH